MKTHFVGFQMFNHNNRGYDEIFINLNAISSVAHCYKEGHSVIAVDDETAFMVKGTPREILSSMYDRVPRDSMTITYSKEEEQCSNT